MSIPGLPLSRFTVLDLTRARRPHRGEHTDSVLQEFGYDAQQIAEFHQHGIV